MKILAIFALGALLSAYMTFTQEFYLEMPDGSHVAVYGGGER